MEMNALNYAVIDLFEICHANYNNIVTELQSCQLCFNFPDMKVLLKAKKKIKFSVSYNCLRSQFSSTAITYLQQPI